MQVAFALPQVAVITALPAPTAVTLPLTTVATCVSELLHETAPLAVATSVALSPTSRLTEFLSSVTVGVGGTSFVTVRCRWLSRCRRWR